MRYPDRRLLFPVAAVSAAWAQQPAPAAAKAEAALRARVEQFYQLQVDKKFRQAEALVAEDSKDEYYDGAKQDIRSFEIQKIELQNDNTRAVVTLKRKVVLKSALIGPQQFEMPLLSRWKVESGQWVWYIDPATVGQTPFGQMKKPSPEEIKRAPLPPPADRMNVANLRKQVTADRNSVALDASNPDQTVTFTNRMPGSITLELTQPQLADVSVELEKSNLKAGETSALRFHRTGPAKSSGVVLVLVNPLNETIEIPVQSN
jgi:hypothetical protein